MTHTIYLVHFGSYELIYRLITNKIFEHVVIVRSPFSWKTPIGFAIAILIESLSCFAALYSILPNTCFVVGSYVLIMSAINIILDDFHEFCDINKNDKKSQKLISVVSNISDIKQLSLE